MSSPKIIGVFRTRNAKGIVNRKVYAKRSGGLYYIVGKSKVDIDPRDVTQTGHRGKGCSPPKSRLIETVGKSGKSAGKKISRCVRTEKEFKEMCKSIGKKMHISEGGRKTCYLTTKAKIARAKSPSKRKALNPAMAKWARALKRARADLARDGLKMRLIKGNELYNRAHMYFSQASGGR